MDPNARLVLELFLFVVAVIVVIAISLVFASRGNAHAAEVNRKENNPVSNGFATVALFGILIIFTIVIITGFLPPLLRRG